MKEAERRGRAGWRSGNEERMYEGGPWFLVPWIGNVIGDRTEEKEEVGAAGGRGGQREEN